MRYFRTEQGELVNVVDHTLEMIKDNPNVRIYIGTDSQVYGPETEFVTVVAYRWEENKGVHYIYLREREKTPRDIFTRLYAEGAKTMETFSIFEEIPIKVEALEFDYAGINKTKSSIVVSSFKGWCEGLGQKALFKGGEMIATRAADHILP